ncbi:hypothetical protein EDB89DRAFT_1911659 [Lactarius sanguifluus]|nr:hypothetical protein EDB89DRAFT_1911659 [Lactarius sanguifluus]
MSSQTIVENECCGVCGGRTAESVNGRKEKKVEWGDILLIECSDAPEPVSPPVSCMQIPSCVEASMGEKEECSDVVKLSEPMSPPGSRTQIPGVELRTSVNGRKGRVFGRGQIVVARVVARGMVAGAMVFGFTAVDTEIAGASTGPDLAEAASSPGLSASGSVCGDTDDGGEKSSERPPRYGGTRKDM